MSGMERIFAVGDFPNGWIAYDPCTGLTHYASIDNISVGRHYMDENRVDSWPIVHPGDLGRSAPVSICWSPLVRCNLHCPHCLDDKSLSEVNALSRRRLASLIAQAGLLGVDISGGEPLLLRDLPDLVERLTRGGLAVSITTNGWLLARRTSEIVGRVDAVRISLDGPNASSHDFWRGRGSFERAIEGLRAAVERDIPVQIQTVAMASNVLRLQELIDLAQAEGVHGVTVLQMLPIGEGASIAPTEMLSDEKIEQVVSNLRIPPWLHVRLRKRQNAAGFTVVRADGSIWRNDESALSIGRRRYLRSPVDLRLQGRDGSA